MKHTIKRFLLIFSITLVIGVLLVGILFTGAVFGFWGGSDLDVANLTMHQNTILLYTDPHTGEEKVLDTIVASENRVWVNIEDTPKHLQHAFVAIEDERFYEHKGYDIRRTVKATATWLLKKLTGDGGSASLGGSTITQQVIKNMTGENEQTASRKIQEISRAVSIEKQLKKDEILELYLNCIYLSQGVNGVQTAAELYFGKDAKDLTLAESASIAGITQFPSLYDPFVNPENNKERQEVVLAKMLELGYINRSQYEQAKSESLNFRTSTKKTKLESFRPDGTTSYFVDQVIRDVLKDLQKKGYSPKLAEKMLYSGGLKIYTTYNPDVQETLEEYYANTNHFPNAGIQSAIAVTDVQTGAIVGMVGGIGEKPGSLTLNRASIPRQPGSTFKPIGVYAPALDRGIINPGSVFDDEAKRYEGWTPRNYDFKYRGPVNVRRALRTSLNTTPVEILNQMGAQESFDFLTQDLGFTTLIKSKKVGGRTLTDIGLPQLALGGLTEGATPVEMAAAYAIFANEGVYHKPHTYTEVKDKTDKLILSAELSSNQAITPSTAFMMHKMLQEVVSSGTGVGASISGYQTAGKTGTTSDNKDRWFVGYTPHYSAAIWYGYDTPKDISVSGNPCITVFRSVMNTIHQKLSPDFREIEQPSDVTRVTYCSLSGMRYTSGCPGGSETYYCSSDNVPGYCSSKHANYVPKEEDEDEEEKTEEETEESAENGETAPDGSVPPGNTVTNPGESNTGTTSVPIEQTPTTVPPPAQVSTPVTITP